MAHHWRGSANGFGVCGALVPGRAPGLSEPRTHPLATAYRPAKLRSIVSPTRWLFSGWNCVAKTFSCQIADANGVG
jgi:hypothetical protein